MKISAYYLMMASLLFSCKKEPSQPKEILTSYFRIANQVVKGDTSQVDFLKTHLSISANKLIEQVPLLLQYSLLTTTRNGVLEKVEIQKQITCSKDSLLFQVNLQYSDKVSKRICQAMVFEKGRWCLSVSPP